MKIHQILDPPVDAKEIIKSVPELRLAQGLEQGPYHHLDVFAHTLQVMRSVERELEERRLGAHVSPGRLEGLRLAGLLHDVAKPITRGEYEGKVLFVSHDTLGARLAHRICRRLEISAEQTDLVATLTALHLKIGFMGNKRADYPPTRLARAAGPFGEELAVLSWADRVAAQGPRLKQEHLDRHYELCTEFLSISRELGAYAAPDYDGLIAGLETRNGADAGYAASVARLAGSRSSTANDSADNALG